MKLLSAFITFCLTFTLVLVSSVRCDEPKLPEPSAGYTAKKQYSVPSSKVFSVVLDVFDNNRITPAMIDKPNGRIASDYVAGPTYKQMGGLLGSNSTRYKFSVSIFEIDPNTTRLAVKAVIESSGNAVQSWRDVSSYNQKVVQNLEDWLYEQVQKQVENQPTEEK